MSCRRIAEAEAAGSGRVFYAENWVYAPAVQKERECDSEIRRPGALDSRRRVPFGLPRPQLRNLGSIGGRQSDGKIGPSPDGRPLSETGRRDGPQRHGNPSGHRQRPDPPAHRGPPLPRPGSPSYRLYRCRGFRGNACRLRRRDGGGYLRLGHRDGAGSTTFSK